MTNTTLPSDLTAAVALYLSPRKTAVTHAAPAEPGDHVQTFCGRETAEWFGAHSRPGTLVGVDCKRCAAVIAEILAAETMTEVPEITAAVAEVAEVRAMRAAGIAPTTPEGRAALHRLEGRVLDVTAANGTTFAVVFIPEGTQNPVNDFRKADKGALVEFFDARFPSFGPFGQFVSGYYADTILGRDGYGHSEGYALSLDGGISAWTVDAATMATVRDWVTTHHPHEVDEDGNPRDYAAEHAEKLDRWLSNRSDD
jgi:hypothetical protein